MQGLSQEGWGLWRLDFRVAGFGLQDFRAGLGTAAPPAPHPAKAGGREDCPLQALGSEHG